MNTVVLIKPDAFERKIVGNIISILEFDFKIMQAKIVYMDSYWISRHYKDHVNKDYYNNLHTFMCSGPTLAMLIFGDPVDLLEYRDEIRNRFGTKNPRNLIHASDLASAIYEINLWFPESC